MKRFVIPFALGLGLLPATPVVADSSSTPERPNIIFFITDDMYWDMFNCLPEGEGRNLTPNLDRLVSEGTLLRNHYVASPVCTPSRYNCLTGQFASRSTAHNFRWKAKQEGGQTVIQWNTFVTAGQKILPHYLQEAGYKTGMVGKNHVIEAKGIKRFKDYWGDPRDPENKALLLSNYEKTQEAILAAGFDYAESLYYDNPRFVGLGELAVQNMEWIAQGGVDFIDRYKDEPFYLYFATTIPHAPSEPAKSWKADPLATAVGFLDEPPVSGMPPRDTLTPRLREAGIKGWNKELVLWLDDALGALIDRLEKHDLMENTIIIFFNDHAQHAKGHLYQGGIHNPSIIWRADGFDCGPVSEALLQNTDYVPTILDFAGLEVDESNFDGKSFKPVLDGESDAIHESLFFELGYARGVIKGDYKYMAIRYPEYARNMSLEERARRLEEYNETRRRMKTKIVNTDPEAPFSHFSTVPGGEQAEHESYGKLPAYFDPDQLYNLKADPTEQVNLAGDPEHAAKLAEMKALLTTYLEDLPGTFGELKE
jgi:arylsulfatase A